MNYKCACSYICEICFHILEWMCLLCVVGVYYCQLYATWCAAQKSFSNLSSTCYYYTAILQYTITIHMVIHNLNPPPSVTGHIFTWEKYFFVHSATVAGVQYWCWHCVCSFPEKLHCSCLAISNILQYMQANQAPHSKKHDICIMINPLSNHDYSMYQRESWIHSAVLLILNCWSWHNQDYKISITCIDGIYVAIFEHL
jgi:hypothetical protein